MKNIHASVLFSAMFAVFAFMLWAGQALAAEISIKGGKVVMAGKALENEVSPIKNSQLQFTETDEEEAKEFGVKAGIHIFDGSGKEVGLIPKEDFAPTTVITMSPEGKMLAVDSGTDATSRGWSFYSFPELKEVGQGVGYIAGNLFDKEGEENDKLLWIDNDNVLIMISLEDQPVRTAVCECPPISVGKYNIPSGKNTVLFTGTPLCDFILKEYKDGTVFVEKYCMQEADWQSSPVDKIKAPEKLSKKLD